MPSLSHSFCFVLSQRYFRFVYFLPTSLSGRKVFFVSFSFVLFYVLHIDYTHLPYRTKKKKYKNGVGIIERGLLLFKSGEKGESLYFIRVHNWAFLSLLNVFVVVCFHILRVSLCVCKNSFLLVV